MEIGEKRGTIETPLPVVLPRREDLPEPAPEPAAPVREPA
jgi:hypothetical protein